MVKIRNFLVFSREKVPENKNVTMKYLNVRNFRVQKISQLSRMTPQFAKLNGREKNIFADSRKLLPRRHGFQISLVIFCLLEHKNRLFSLFYSCFCLENQFRENLFLQSELILLIRFHQNTRNFANGLIREIFWTRKFLTLK